MSTSSYVVNPISGNGGGCFRPYVAPDDPAGTPSGLTIDDRYSLAIPLGWTMPFFSGTYNQIAISSNGYITFDSSRASPSLPPTSFSHWSIINGTPQDLPSTFYDKALVMGAYQDFEPSYTTSPNRRLQYQVFGTAPHRRMIISYYKMPMFQCSSGSAVDINNTQQIVLYEGTGIIEVFIYERESCASWNQGRAMIGLQDITQTQAIMPPGRKASDPVWQGLNMNEAWRFVPAGGNSALKRVELRDLSGNLIRIGTTTPGLNNTVNVSFDSVCSGVGTTPFIVKSVYKRILDTTQEEYGTDTVRIVKNGTVLTPTTTTTAAGCAPTGTITVTMPTSGSGAGVPPYTYSLDNSPIFQSSNVLTNVSGGTHVVTVKDATGCSTNISVNVGSTTTIQATFATTPAVCGAGGTVTVTPAPGQGIPPFLYSLDGSTGQAGNTFNNVSPGTHTIVVTDSVACTATLSITIAPAPPITGTATTYPAGCNPTGKIFVTVNSGIWAPPYTYSLDGGTAQGSATFTNVSSGPHTVHVVSAAGCSGDITVTVPHTTAVSATATTTTSGCNPSGTVTVTPGAGTGVSPYTYSLDGGTAQAGSLFNNVGAGTHSITVMDSVGCTYVFSAVVQASPPVLATATTTPSSCVPNGTATVTVTSGTAPYTYSIDNSTAQSSNTFSSLVAGTHFILVTDATGCTMILTVSVGAPALLSASAVTTPSQCTSATGTVTVTASGNPPYQYSINGTTFQASNVFNNVAPGTYTVLVKDAANCTYSVTPSAVVGTTNNLFVNITTPMDTIVCYGSKFVLRAVSNATNFSWTPSQGIDANGSTLTPVISASTFTQYIVTATTGICSIVDTFRMVIAPLPTVDAGANVNLVFGDSVQLNATASPGNYVWTPALGLSATNILNPWAKPLQTTTYTITVTSAQNCLAQSSVVVTVNSCIAPMSAFTPNGDGVNDVWLVTQTSCLASAQVQVFNRYGTLVFEDNDYKNTWNGTYKGNSLPDGTYYFIIKYKTINGQQLITRGNVTILR